MKGALYVFDDHFETAFDEAYDKIYYTTKDQLENDPNYTYEHLKAFLESLYVHEGNDWYGRGELFQVKINARIAAVQTLMDEFSHLDKRSDKAQG